MQSSEFINFLWAPIAAVIVLFLYAVSVVAFATIFVSLFLSCVFAFGAIATNSISGQNRLQLNILPMVCIPLMPPCVVTTVGHLLRESPI